MAQQGQFAKPNPREKGKKNSNATCNLEKNHWLKRIPSNLVRHVLTGSPSLTCLRKRKRVEARHADGQPGKVYIRMLALFGCKSLQAGLEIAVVEFCYLPWFPRAGS